MNKYTEEQREWIVNHEDYPAWLIAENFKDRFKIDVTAGYIKSIRWKHFGTSSKKDRHSRLHRENGRCEEIRRTVRIRHNLDSDSLRTRDDWDF